MSACGDVFLIYASANDGQGATASCSVRIEQKCTKVTLYPQSTPGMAPGIVTNRNGVLSSVGLFNVDIQESSATENQIQLYAVPEGSSRVPIAWTSNKSSVATVDEDGTVTAHKAGTATITATAQDGSGKKANVTIKVTVPVSSMSLTASAAKGNLGLDALAIGKSYSHKVSFGKLYGTPTNQKVIWSWAVYTIQNGEDVDISNEVQRMISCAGGKLNVKSGMNTYLCRYGNLQVTIFAESLDGTDVVASRTYNLVQGATFVKFINGLRKDNNGDYYLTFISDQVVATDSRNNKFGDFVVISSNSRVLNPIQVDTGSYSSYYGGYIHWLTVDTDTAHGKATITIKTTDGTNKSAKFTVTVR